MLETIRDYGLEQLEANGERAAAEHAHARYYLAMAEAAAPALCGPEQAFWLDRLEIEADNLRAVLRWAHDHDTITVGVLVAGELLGEDREDAGVEAPVGLRLAAALWQFWSARGLLSEGHAWLNSFLANEDEARAAKRLAQYGAQSALPAVRATALAGAGVLAAEQADYGRAEARLEESLMLRRATGDARGTAEVLNILGTIARDQEQYEDATTLLGESLEIYRSLNDSRSIAATMCSLAEVWRYRGDLERAAELLDDSLTMLRNLGDRQGAGTAILNRGLVACDQGDERRALALHQEGLALFRALGDQVGVAWSLEGIAGVAFALGQAERATQLLARSSALRAALNAPLPPAARAGNAGLIASARAALGKERFNAAWARGVGLTLEEAIDAALAPA
jgi:tetratricopeptide (TPR) repeat protein